MAALLLPAAANGRAYVPPAGHVFAGLTAGTSTLPWERRVGKHPPVFEVYMTWNTPTRWLADRRNTARVRLGVHMSTAQSYGGAGVISPEEIAVGRSDRFLVEMNHNLAYSQRVVYVRIMGEMNGYWNAYAAYNADGSYRGAQNSPINYIQAWRRTVLILRGGQVARINRRLRSQGLPRIKARLHGRKRLPRPKVAFLWVPQDAGSPDMPQNASWRFWPGRDYADWVGTDFYSSYPNFTLLNRFYNEFWQRPFVISEWAVYGSDDPGFVHAMFAWGRSHRRLRMFNYYQGFTGQSAAYLGRYPASQAALRQELRSPRYLAYAPEYAHPKCHHRKRPPPGRPPQPPQPGLPPGPPPSPSVPCVPVLGICPPAL